MKRINIIIMTMLTALIALPAFARDFEYDGLTYTVLDESALTCQTKAGGYVEGAYVAGNAVTGEVVIPATVTDGTNSYSVVKIGDYGFAEASELTAITISEGIKTIGTKAFSYCEALTKVGLPETLVSIEPFAFEFSTVNNVVIPASITEINDGVFYRCSQLKEIQLPETLTSIGTYAFAYTPDNISITLPNSLKTIGDLAFCASGVRAIVLPESLVSIGLGAFSQGELRFWNSDCFLTDVTIPASIEEIGDFAFCKYSTYYKDINVVYNAETPREFSGSLFNDETYTTGTLTMPNATLADIQATAPWNRFTHIVARDGAIAPPETEENFVFNGITYTILDKNAKTCKVKDYWWTDEVKSTISPEMFAGDVFVIPTTVSDGTDSYTVTEIGSNSFNACDSLKSVKLPEKLQIIGTNAFMSCSYLSSIELPPTLTTIGNGAFSFTESLTSIDLPASLKYLDIQAFNTSGLTEVTIPEGVTYLSNAVFNYCQKLEKVNLPSTLTAIGGGAFYYCNSLSSLDIKNCPLTTIQYDAFLLCPLEDIQLPSTLAIIGRGAFQTTKPNAEIVFPESLKVIGESAFNNTGLSSISLPASLSFIGTEAFTNNKLKEITYAASKPISPLADIFYVEGSESYHYNAFNEAQLNMPNATLAEVQSTLPWSLFKRIYASDGTSDPGLAEGKDFEYEGLTFTVIDTEAKTCRTKAGNFYYGTYTPGSKVSGDVVIPAIAKLGINDYSVVEIGEYSFTTDSLTSITIPESVITIGSNAFTRCYTLPSITIPESVTTLGETIFDSCWRLKSVELPGSIETMGYGIFHTCDSIVSVTYNAVNPIVGPWETFYSDVYDTATLYMPNATLADIQNIKPWSYFKKVKAKDGSVGMPLEAGQDFEYEGLWYTVIDAEAKTCRTKSGVSTEDSASPGNNVEGDLVIPSKVSDGTYEYTVVEIGEDGFRGCNITSLTLPESVTSIAGAAFFNCEALSTITFSEGLQSIGEIAFNGCKGLTSLSLPTSVTAIGQWAFYYCENLSSVGLPASLTSIGEFTFHMCNNINIVEYQASTPITAPENLFTETVYNSATLNMPNATLETVQATVPWNLFKKIVAKDGTVEPGPEPEPGLGAGEDFEYEGLWYTVLDTEAMTCKTKEGVINEDMTSPGNSMQGDLVIPSKVSDGNNEYSVVEIGANGFRGSMISSVTLPETVTTIRAWAFSYCYYLSSVKLPSSLTSIEEYAFNMCKEISQVEYDAADPITVSMTIFEGNVYDTATLNMPNSTLKVVQSTVPWNMFNHIVASDGTVGFMPGEGETVEYRGLLYTILTVNEAEQTGTVSTKAGEGFGVPGNSIYGDVEIPGGFEVDDVYYEVKQIGEFGFAGSDYLTSITLPTAIENIGMDAFSGCPRLTSLVWQAHNQMPEEAIYSIGNPNLLVYVDSIQFAPATLDKNVVVMLNASQHFECEKLVLTPGYPFTPLYSFDAHNSSMTKSFKQKTPIDGCGGWETIVLPFDVTDIVTYDDRHLTSFISFNDPETQYPFWLCDANPEGEWNYAESIKAGVPYIISMPNNEKYRKRYRISGNVTFSNSETVRITPETTAPYSTTWASGRQFRSLWLPLNQEEAYNAMGLNVGISDLTDNEGVTLLPGSAFHIGIEPKPLEAYVTRIDAQMAHRVIGNQSGVLMMPDDSDLSITGAYGSIVIASGEDRTVDIYTPEGMLIRTVTVAAGEPCTVTDLTKGIYIVANRKIAVK